MSMSVSNWNISGWCIKHPVPTIVLFLVMTVAGISSFFTLGIDENPNIDVPFVVVTVTQSGAAPVELEQQITRKVEDSIAGIGNIKHLTSTVNSGVSTTMVEFELGTNTDRAVNDVRDAVTRIRQQLPRGIDEPIVQRVDFVGEALLSYSVSSPSRTPEELSWIVDNQIARTLMTAPGVGRVERYGGVDREVRVNLDPVRLEAFGVTADMVNSQIRDLNANMPGGRGQLGSSEQAIRTLGSARTIDDLRKTQIALPGGRWAPLDTLGEVVDGASDQRQLALLDGKPVIAFDIIRSTGSNVVDVEGSVFKKIAELEKTLPPDIKISLISNEAEYVHESFTASFDALILGAGLAVLVIWLFLKDWRSAVISAFAMPLSVIPTFAYLKYSGYTLNDMSLLGLSLVIGILVDDAIVEIENIVRHICKGKPPYEASIDAADEIGLAVIATTMAVVVVFVPVAFMSGIVGQFFKQFGLTVAVAVFFSLVVARMMTPLMAAYWLKPLPEESERSAMVALYEKWLTWALNRRLQTVIVAVLFFAASLALFQMLPTSLMSKVDRSKTALKVDLAPGSTVADTERVARRLTEILLKHQEVKSVFATIGSAAGSGGEVNHANLDITLVPRTDRHISQAQFEDLVRPEIAQVPGIKTLFRAGWGSGRLSVLLTSNNGEALNKTAEQLADEMRKVPGFNDVKSSAAVMRPELLVKPDFARAADQGVSVQSIAHTALIATLGDIDANLPKFDLPDRQINIRVQIDPRYRDDIEVIGNLKVMAANGKLVPLRSVADVDMGTGAFQIDRWGRSRQVSIDSNLSDSISLGDAVKIVHNLPAFKNKPADVQEHPSGNAEAQKDIFSGFGSAIFSAVMLIYAVLVILFGGFLQPFTIMMSLPLALGGALLGLLLFGQSLGMFGLIGIVMLMGLVTKNAILLVEYALVRMRAGVPRVEALMEAGRTRMRPIVMTTVAMIAGMVPIAIGVGAGSEARAPMALSVIGGLITSTILTLIVVPVVFTYIDDFQRWIIKRFKPSRGGSSASAANGADGLSAGAAKDNSVAVSGRD